MFSWKSSMHSVYQTCNSTLVYVCYLMCKPSVKLACVCVFVCVCVPVGGWFDEGRCLAGVSAGWDASPPPAAAGLTAGSHTVSQTLQTLQAPQPPQPPPAFG